MYRFIKSAAISNNFLYGRRVCSNKQPFLSIVGPAYSRGEILFLGYKWRFFTSFLHSTLILYLIFYPPTLVIWIWMQCETGSLPFKTKLHKCNMIFQGTWERWIASIREEELMRILSSGKGDFPLLPRVYQIWRRGRELWRQSDRLS